MELDELDVGDVGARLVSEGDAVAGGPGRVGGVPPEGGCPTGREDHRTRRHSRPLPGGGIAELDPGAAVAVPHQLGDHLTLEDGGAALVKALQQRGLDGRAGGVAAGMEHPGPAVSSLPVKVDAVPVAVECHAPVGQLGHPGRRLLDHQAHRPLVAEAATGGHGVLEVQLRGVVGADRGGDPALGGRGAAVVGAALADHQHAGARGGGEHGGEPGDATAHDHDVGGRSSKSGSHGQSVIASVRVPVARWILALTTVRSTLRSSPNPGRTGVNPPHRRPASHRLPA